jgi:hypothetical protein
VAQRPRERIDKLDYMQVKSFCKTKEMVFKMKRLLNECEKFFASFRTDKGLITRIDRELNTKFPQKSMTQCRNVKMN